MLSATYISLLVSSPSRWVPLRQRRSVREVVLGERLGVSSTSRHSSLARLANLRLLFRRQLDLQRAEVLLEASNVGGTRDLKGRRQSATNSMLMIGREGTYREDVIALGEQPRQGQLTGGGVLLASDFGDAVDELQVLWEVLLRESRSLV